MSQKIYSGTIVMLFSIALAGFSFSARAQVPNIAFCSNCSSAGFALAAEQAAPLSAGIYPFYVIDAASGEVRYFDVNVWWDCDGDHPQSLPSGKSGRSADSDTSIQFFCTQKEAIQGAGDASIIYEMQNAHFAVSEFTSTESFQIDSSDIPNSGDSAVDLIGPWDSSAGAARGNLAIGVANHLEGFWSSQVHSLTDLAERIADQLIGSSDYLSHGTLVTVHYTDGTRIKLKVVDISTSPGSPTVTVLVEVLPETGQLPDGRMVPQVEGHFDGFYGEGDIVDKIMELATRYGIPITGAGGGGGGTITCIRDEHGVTCRIE